MNKQKLEAEMKLRGLTGADMANMLGIARATFSLKINENGAEFTKSEIDTIRKEWKLSAEETCAIFFN